MKTRRAVWGNGCAFLRQNERWRERREAEKATCMTNGGIRKGRTIICHRHPFPSPFSVAPGTIFTLARIVAHSPIHSLEAPHVQSAIIMASNTWPSSTSCRSCPTESQGEKRNAALDDRLVQSNMSLSPLNGTGPFRGKALRRDGAPYANRSASDTIRSDCVAGHARDSCC